MWPLLLACTDPHPLDDVLRWNHVQAIGTHNSYHVQTDGVTMEELAYTHSPLDVQLGEQGVRHFELDIDRADGETFRVRHIAVIDEASHCATLAECLATIDGWSAAHPDHGPILVLLEVKENVEEEIASAWLDALDAIVFAGIAEERLLTPARVQGDAPDLATAVAAGWPTLRDTRGRIMVVLYDDALRAPYAFGDTSLTGRAMFPMARGEASAWVAFDVLDDPADPAMPDVLARGNVVRTRADGWPDPDAERGALAIASGAQWISTDFPVVANDVDYAFGLGSGAVYACNPVTAPPECTPGAIETLDAR